MESFTKVLDPLALYVQNEAKGGACVVKGALGQISGGATDTALVAGVSGKYLLVLSVDAQALTAATSFVLNTKPGGAGTAISPRFYVSNTTNFLMPFSPAGHYQTAVGEGISVTTGAGSAVDVHVRYIEVEP